MTLAIVIFPIAIGLAMYLILELFISLLAQIINNVTNWLNADE